VINLQGVVGDQAAPRRSELRVGYLAGEPLAGPADWWGETITGFMDDGFDTIVFWPVDPSPDQVELLIREVVPFPGIGAVLAARRQARREDGRHVSEQ
jgi:hypothetical protein